MGTGSLGSFDNDNQFGRRKISPRACIIDCRPHACNFLGEVFESAGFVTGVCTTPSELAVFVKRQPPRLTVLSVSQDGNETAHVVRILSEAKFRGSILLLGPEDLPALAAVWHSANELGLRVLPPLFTPFSDKSLRASVATLLSDGEGGRPPIDVAEALASRWLELWYQPKVNAHSLCFDSAEALVRIRHPVWGVVPPAYFIPDDSDPHAQALSEFVLGEALRNWRHWVVDHGHVEIAINLPVAFLRDPRSIENLCRQLPSDPAFGGMIVEVNGTEVLRNLDLMKEIAAQVRFHKIGIAIDDLGAEWTSLLTNVGHFPFVEIKVDRKFIAGCANDRLKRSVCCHILQFANSVGSRSIAEGVETREDWICVREMGFDVVQGFLFGRPMPAVKFGQYLPIPPVAPRECRWHPIEGLIARDIGRLPRA